MLRYILILIIPVSFIACSNRHDSGNKLRSIQSPDISGETKMKYAVGFTIKKTDSATFIQVNDPWKSGERLASYWIVKEKNWRKYEGHADFVIKAPVNHVAIMSSVCIGFLKILNEENKIEVSSNARMIYDSMLYNRYLKGDLVDLGEALEVNAEAIIGTSPDILVKFIYGNRDANDQKVIGAGIPIAYMLEFMEPHPLGRAEWLKFIAAFVDKSELADSLFTAIEQEYTQLKQKASDVTDKPTVLDGSSYKGIWYAAGGKSFPAHLYADAGAEYYWKNDSSQGSIPLSFEVILDRQSDADFWIGPSTGSRKELLDIESRYSLLKSFKEGNVYFLGKRINPNGGLDYYESGVAHPDILLKDLLWIFHPDILESSYQPVYLERIKE